MSKESLKSLPHGPEFRFVDELVALDPGQSGEAHYHIRGDEEFLKGHFPENPLMPGVILVEAIAQLGGVVAQTDPDQATLNQVRLSAITNAKIKGAAKPGQTLVISARLDGRLGNLLQISGSVSCDGLPMATAKVVLSGQNARTDEA